MLHLLLLRSRKSGQLLKDAWCWEINQFGSLQFSNALGLKNWGEEKIFSAEQKESLTELTEMELDAAVDNGYTSAIDAETPFSKKMQLEQTENGATAAEDLPYTEAQLSHAEKVPHTEPASSHLETDHSQVETSQTSPRKDRIAEATHHDVITQKVDHTTDTLMTFTPLPVEAVDSEQVPEDANWAPWDDEDDEDGEATAAPVTAPSTENGEGPRGRRRRGAHRGGRSGASAEDVAAAMAQAARGRSLGSGGGFQWRRGQATGAHGWNFKMWSQVNSMFGKKDTKKELFIILHHSSSLHFVTFDFEDTPPRRDRPIPLPSLRTAPRRKWNAFGGGMRRTLSGLDVDTSFEPIPMYSQDSPFF